MPVLTLQAHRDRSSLVVLQALDPQPPAAPGGGEHPHHARSGGRSLESGDALFGGQGQLGDAASRPQGVLPGQASVPVDARRYDVEVPRDVHVPRPHGRGARHAAHRAHQPRRARPGDQPLRARLGHPHRRDEDAGTPAGVGQARIRRRLRRRAPRRGEVARQGAHLLLPLHPAPLGPEDAAPGALAALQHAEAQGRVVSRLSALQLDRARRLAIHPSGEHPGGSPLLRQGAPGGRARGHAHPGRRRAAAASRRRGADGQEGSLPDAWLLSPHRGRRIRGRHAAVDHPGDAAGPDLRAAGPRHRPRFDGFDGEEEAGGVLLREQASDLVATDIDTYLRQHASKGMLRFITCGSVDDGKSTLIGRLLYESKMLTDDELAALAGESRKFGTQGDDLDFALLVDGLSAEREQGITIDVAYRFFSTSRRKFIVADTPGHEQYTRNMVTGASTAEAAILLVDARKGMLTQTRRHSYLVSLIGIRHVALAVNKMDLVGYSQERFREIEADYLDFARQVGCPDVTCIPLSALKGDNIIDRSPNLPWYRGATLTEWLETVEVDEE